MGKLLFGLFGWAMSNFVARVLTSIGFAILGSITFSQFIEYFVQKALQQFSQIPMLGLLGISGIDTAISIWISAIMMRLYLSTVVQSLKIVKK